MTPAEVLRKAAEYLETYGWCQGYYRRDGGERCLMGAVAEVLHASSNGNNAAACRRYEEMKSALRPSINQREPVNWNDTPGRTAEEVIAKLREVADKLDAEAAK